MQRTHARTAWTWVGLAAAGLALQAGLATAAELRPSDPAVDTQIVLPPASARFANPKSTETPDFQRHVLPLMGRLGCNGRACHGSFQGQGGFRLSLFGYDFQADHEALVAGDAPRVDLKSPRTSMILEKPTGTEDDHGGGHRLDVDSWQYRVLLKWIESGAQPVDTEQAAAFGSLEVTPAEFVFNKVGQTGQLRVVAHWSDGSAEDVTPLCRFQTNDESIATIDESGKVTVVGKGDTHVVAFYDNGVVPVSVLLPVSDQVGPSYPEVPTPTEIDRLVVNKLRKLGMVPSELCADEEFLRRVTLDITGLLPSPEAVRAFMEDARPDKRQRKIDELLASPGYSAWWATRLCDMTGNSERAASDANFRSDVAEQWYRWVHARVADNMPYDELIEKIVMATGRAPGQSFEDYCAEMTSYFRRSDRADFTQRETMPHYWTRNNVRQASEKALSFSHAFLGVRLQCAECHKHPFDQWSQEDFRHFQAFFEPIVNGNRNEDRDTMRKMTAQALGEKANLRGGDLRRVVGQEISKGTVLPFNELYISTSRTSPRRSQGNRNVGSSRVITPRVLGGDEVLVAEYDDPRQPLMDWLRSEENPYFAKAFVNRVWSHYFGVGIVEPPDDMNLANAPSNAELLDWLAAEFVRQGYDMHWLHRTITNSRTYQLSWKPNETNLNDQRNFSRCQPRRLPAEVVFDAVQLATANKQTGEAMRQNPVEQCSIGLSRGYYQGAGRTRVGYALSVFGKPMRETPCDCERSNEATLLQTVFLRNDSEMLGLIDRNDGWLAEVAGTATGESNRGGDRQIEALRGRLRGIERFVQQARARNNKEQLQMAERRRDEVRRQLAALEQEAKVPPAAELDADELVRQAYLRTLSRLPSGDELAAGKTYLAESETPLDGVRDLLWALLNTKEFLLNH